jgi:hypothetical protein
VKTIFLDGELEEIYMTHPEHYVEKNKKSLAFKLKKFLYGFKWFPKM